MITVSRIFLGLQELGWEIADWSYLVQYRDFWQILMKVVTILRVP